MWSRPAWNRPMSCRSRPGLRMSLSPPSARLGGATILAASILAFVALPVQAAAQDGGRGEGLLLRLAELQQLVALGAEAVPAWVDLEVRIYEEFWPRPEWGRMEITFRDAGNWTFVHGGAEGGERFHLAPGIPGEGAGSLRSISEVAGFANEVCWDGSGNRHETEYEGPPRIGPGAFRVGTEGDPITLWYGAPIIEMVHPGHAHLPQLSDCFSMAVRDLVELRVSTSELEEDAEGAVVNEDGDFLLATLSWNALAAAARGDGDPVPLELILETEGILFEVRGSISPPRR